MANIDFVISYSDTAIDPSFESNDNIQSLMASLDFFPDSNEKSLILTSGSVLEKNTLLFTKSDGAMNLSKFNKVEWEFETIEPVDASFVSVSITCDASGTPIDPHPPTSADKGYWKTFKYHYNLLSRYLIW